MITPLFGLFENNVGRTIHKFDHYFPIYERHLARYIGINATFLEIGAGLGGSAQMWKAWLGPEARIISLDIRPECAEFAEEQIVVRIGHQADTRFLAGVLEEFGAPDVVLDDGSHHSRDQIGSFEFLYPRIALDGVYLVEDLHTAYMARYGGGLNMPGSFIEFCKSRIDAINGAPDDKADANDFSRITTSMHVYDAVAVFERGPPVQRRVVRRIPAPPADTQMVWPPVDPL